MFKKILSILFLFYFSLFGVAFSENLNGPTSKPSVKGPLSAPPTMEELKKIKCSKDPEFINTVYCEDKKKEIGFFEKIWNWILSFFK